MAQVSTPLWQAQILTLFPEMFPGPLGVSLAGKALEKGIWTMDVVQIRDYATDKHRNVDDTPAGGGPGMVMRADVLGGPATDAGSGRTVRGRRACGFPRGLSVAAGQTTGSGADSGICRQEGHNADLRPV